MLELPIMTTIGALSDLQLKVLFECQLEQRDTLHYQHVGQPS